MCRIIMLVLSIVAFNCAFADEKETMAQGRVYLDDFVRISNHLDSTRSSSIACFLMGELGQKLKIAFERLKKKNQSKLTEIEKLISELYGQFTSKKEYDQRELYCQREWEQTRGELLDLFKTTERKLFVLTAEFK